MRIKLALSMFVVLLVIAATLGATFAYFTDDAELDPVSFQAGTLTIEGSTSLIYGVERGTGDLYEIDVVTGEEMLLFDGTTNNENDQNYPNALAYDRNNNRLYYANSDRNLYFHEIGSGIEEFAGTLSGSQSVAGATFGRGYYWYIPQNSSTLYRANFDADGQIESNDEYIQTISDTDGNDITFSSFGDIAMEIQGNLLYGSARVGGNNKYFVIDLTTKETVLYLDDNVSNMLQLAFGADGELYGHATNEREWFSINADTGVIIDDLFTGDNHYTDLASNWQNNWNPGDCDMARFFVRNTGSKTSHVRAELIVEWENNETTLDSGKVDVYPCDWEKTDSGYNIPENSTWKPAPDNNSWTPDDPLYYQGILEPGQEAVLCLKVCFSSDAENEYQAETFTLKPKFEAIQTTNDAPKDTWTLIWDSEAGAWITE